MLCGRFTTFLQKVIIHYKHVYVTAIEIQKNNRTLESRETESSSQQPPGYMSAESVAIALLKRFSEKQLPKASELEWLVSEQDAPQRVGNLSTERSNQGQVYSL